MEISGAGFNPNLLPSGTAAAAPAATAPPAPTLATRLAEARVRAELGILDDSLSRLGELFRTASARGAGPASTRSALDIGLGSAPLSATVLRSSAEVNATPTSFTPFGPDWDGTSTALMTLDGVYDGSLGDATISVAVKKDGVHGVDNLQLEIALVGGGKLENLNINKNDPLDTQYQLETGLVLTFGPGVLNRDESLEVQLFTSQGSAVDPDKPLNGTRDDNPNLEYGLAVTDGSFEINGVSIAVSAGDTLNQVLDRISASAAGVTATFDAAAERVVLTQQQLGSGHDIVLGNDSSGFLSAVKLLDAVAEPGQDGDANTVLADLPQFAKVASGSILINRVAVAIDVEGDTLQDLLDRISASEAGVDAALLGQRAVLTARDKGQVMRLDSNATAFFQALHIRAGRHLPVARSATGEQRAEQIVDAVDHLAQALNRVYGASTGEARRVPAVTRLRDALSEVLANAAPAAGERRIEDLGLGFDAKGGAQAVGFGPEQREVMAHDLRNYFIDMREIFIGESELPGDGLLGRMQGAASAALSRFGASALGAGTLIDALV